MRFALLMLVLLVTTPALAEPAKPTIKQPAKKLRHLSVLDVENAIRNALTEAPLQRNASLVSIHTTAMDIEAFDKVTLDVPQLPRRAGPMAVTVAVTFFANNTIAARTTARFDIVLPPEAALAPIPKGAPILLSIKRGLVEVTISGYAGADGDIGGVIPVVLKPSGRILRARAIDKDHAVAEES